MVLFKHAIADYCCGKINFNYRPSLMQIAELQQ